MDSIRDIVSRLRENKIMNERKDYSKYSRDELIELAQEGDSLALETLLKSHKSLIHMIARKYFLTGGDEDDVEQVANVGFWQAVMDWNGHGNFDAFAGMYMKRAIAKEIDKESAEKSKINMSADSLDAQVSGDGEDERTLGDIIPARGASVEDEVAGRDAVKSLTKFLKDNFKSEELELFQMYRDGYKTKEISEVRGMSYKTVDNIIYKIKYKLKEYLNNNSVRESKRLMKDIEFSDEENHLIDKALKRVKESFSLDESKYSELSDKYEGYSENQLDMELDDIESDIEDIYRWIPARDYDHRDEFIYQLSDLRDKISAMEEYLTDEQFTRSEELRMRIYNAEDVEYNPDYYDDRADRDYDMWREEMRESEEDTRVSRLSRNMSSSTDDESYAQENDHEVDKTQDTESHRESDVITIIDDAIAAVTGYSDGLEDVSYDFSHSTLDGQGIIYLDKKLSPEKIKKIWSAIEDKAEESLHPIGYAFFNIYYIKRKKISGLYMAYDIKFSTSLY